MATTTNKILLKKSSVEGKIPGAFDIEYGELALNFSDGRLYFKDSDNNIQFFKKSEVASGAELNFVDILNDPFLGKVADNDVTGRVNLESVIGSVNDSFDLGFIAISGPIFPSLFVLPSSTVANLPDGSTGQMLLVTDEISGTVPAFYDGTSWKRVSDNQTVSTT